MKRNRIKVNLIVEGDISYANNQERLSVYLLSHNFNLKKGTNAKILSYPVHLSLVLKNDNKVSYISQQSYFYLETEWTKNALEKFYKVEQVICPDYKVLTKPTFDSSNLFESRIKFVPSNTYSNDLAKLMISNLNDSQDLLSKIKNKSYKVAYFDKYNQSEFSLRIMLQFVNQIKEEFAIDISDLTVHLEKAAFKGVHSPEFIIHNYKDAQDYTYDLKELSNNFNFSIAAKEEYRLPHYRYFEFSSIDTSFTVRIDGGIAHGIKPKERLTSYDMTYEDQIFEIRKDVNYDMIFNINYEG